MQCRSNQFPSLVASWLFASWLFASFAVVASASDVLIVVGAPGEDEYAKQFVDWAKQLETATAESDLPTTVIGVDESSKNDPDKARLTASIASLANVESKTTDVAQPVWIFLIGHGTFADAVAKFNLRGPDISASELAQAIAAIKRPVAIINCSSSSGPFVNALSGPRRIVVTATQSGDEQEFARFGKFMTKAIVSRDGDLDHDDEVSILEAFIKAAAEVDAFYRTEDRIATEHALIDDNGDGLGTPADAFVGLEVPETTVAKSGKPDGEVAWQFTLIPSEQTVTLSDEKIAIRDENETAIRELRRRKATLEKAEYWSQLETLLIRQAELYRDAAKPSEREASGTDQFPDQSDRAK